MKKTVLFLLLIIVVVTLGYTWYIKFNGEKEIKNEVLSMTHQEEVVLNKYYVYGQYLNLEGTLDIPLLKEDIQEVKLVFKNSKEEETEFDILYQIENGNLSFVTSNIINDGIYLDAIQPNNYYVLIKVTDKEDLITYYSFKNNTSYKELEYYTLTKNEKNNKVLVGFGADTFMIENKNHKEERKIGYMNIRIKETTLPDNVYDIVIDPGHGGPDSGAVRDQYYEKDITLEYGKLLKPELEKLGYKVILTRDGTREENMGVYDVYGNDGRAVIPNKVKAKYAFSIHLNSAPYKMSKGGVEVYSPSNADLKFAKLFADQIVKEAKTTYSPNETGKIYDGVYVRIFTKDDIALAKSQAINDGYEPYDIKENTPYYFIIRETGGIATNAYVDGRNTQYEKNPYYDANMGVETYLLELGFMVNDADFNNILNNKSGYVSGIVNAIKLNFNQ